MIKNYNVISLPLQCSDSAETSNKAWKKKKKDQCNQSWWLSCDFNLVNKVNIIKRSNIKKYKQIVNNLSHATFITGTRKVVIQMLVAISK